MNNFHNSRSKLKSSQIKACDEGTSNSVSPQSYNAEYECFDDPYDYKTAASRKFSTKQYNKRSSTKRNKIGLQNQYDDIVDDLHNLRINRSSSKLIEKKVHQLEAIKKQKKKFNLYAHSLDIPIPDFQKMGVPILDLVRGIVEQMKVVREKVGESTLKFFIDIFTTLYNIYKNPTWDSMLVNITSFVTRNFPSNYTDIIINWFKEAFTFLTAQSSLDNIKTIILQLFDGTLDLVSDQIWTKISEFFAKVTVVYGITIDIISLDQIDMPTIISKFAIFKRGFSECRDVVDLVFQSVQFVLGNWESICTGNWDVFLLGKDEAEEFEIEIRNLEQAFPLVSAGNEVELQRIYNLTISQFESRVAEALKKAKQLINRCSSVQQRMSVSNFIRSLSDKQAELDARRADAPTREEPYSIKFSGPSSCGKSTLINMVSKCVLQAYNLDPNEHGQVVFTNIDEKFESTIQPTHKIICADDVANNKSSRPNYDRILNYVNVVPRPLEKADSKEKGMKYPGNVAFMATTNDEGIRAQECSVCPESILRRFHLDVEVSIRDEFKNNYGGLKKLDDVDFGVYKFVLKRFDYIDAGKIVWDVIPRSEWNTFEDEEHDIHALLKFISKDIRRHINAQKKRVETNRKLNAGGFCLECEVPEILCTCCESEKLDAQFGTIWSSMSTVQLWDLRESLSSIPNFINNYHRQVIFYQKLWQSRQDYKNFILAFIGSVIFGAFFSSNLALFLCLCNCGITYNRWCNMLRDVDEELARRNDRLSSLCISTEEHLRANMKKYFAIGGSLIMAYSIYRALRPLIFTQDKSTFYDAAIHTFDLKLKDKVESKQRLRSQDERDYKEGYSRVPPSITRKSATTTSEDLQTSVSRSLRSVCVKNTYGVLHTVNGIMVASNVLMMPGHAIPEGKFSIETSSQPGVPSAKTKDQNLDSDFYYIDVEHDVAFVHLASAPASSSYKEFFPKDLPSFYNKSTVLLWKAPDGKVINSLQASRPTVEAIDYIGKVEKPGHLYGVRSEMKNYHLEKGHALQSTLEFNSFNGLCGSLYLDRDSGIIYGMHVAGSSDSPEAYATCITQDVIETALNKLDRTSPTLVVHSASDVSVSTYGKPFELVNEKPNYLREDGTKDKTIVSFLGKVLKDGLPMEGRARTPYIPTPFVGIEEEFGVSKHKPPTKVNDIGKGMKTLNKLTNPVQHYEGDILKLAVNDYKQHTLKVIAENRDECSDMLRIYSQEEALDGIGEFGLGGLPNDTSAGFPLMCSKKKCFKKDPADESLVQVPREFSDSFDIQAEVDSTINHWTNLERSEPIYKASSKVNELLPNKKAEDKVRKFYGSPIANFIASRRVLAGIPRFMRKFWKTTECLVGINATSREWDEFHTYLTKYSTTHMIAGDFSGFDTRMAAQITGAAAQIMVEWYREVGLSEIELNLVKGALSDIIHPNILFDGDLYRFANGNPSGNLITVQLNSICNSLMMRYVYYAMMPTIQESFASNVCLGTYGDDNAMSVKHHCTWFTHTSCQNEFEKLDIGYTMAEKDAESLPYIGIEDISFLKRGFVYHEDLKKIVAPIESDSSYKKFYYIKKPNETPLSKEEQFSAYTDGSFRDRYLYGRKAYDQFTESIKRIVSKNPELRGRINFIPYDDMTKILSEDYQDSFINNNKKLFVESLGVPDEGLFE